jgi:antitoxin (DNA-binding transcriptional repressor) of toxin-antitoxin stability system
VVGNPSIRPESGLSEGNLAIGIGQLRGDLRNYVERVVTGETFDVWRRGRPVARFDAAHNMHPMLIPVRLSDIRQCGAQLLDKVADGETVAIAYRGRTVAALRPWRKTG